MTPVDIPGVLLIEPDIVRDHRGYFFEIHHDRRYRDAGIAGRFVQDNFSRSVRNTLRGLTFPRAACSRETCLALEGTVYDLVVDLRKGSPSFGKWHGVELSGENLLQLYVPPGCAHGFCVTSETAAFMYKCKEYYSPNDERGILWNDPAPGISWPVTAPILSEKDRSHGTLRTMDTALPLYRPDHP